SGMGDDLGCVNVASKNMLSFTGSDGDPVGNVEDVAVEVETPSSDFGEEDGEKKEPRVADVMDFQHFKNESNDEDAHRRPSPVEILKRNFGIPKPSLRDRDVERELEIVDSMLENLGHRRLAGNPRTRCSSSIQDGEESSAIPDFLTSLELGDPELPGCETRSSEEPQQSKEHVYCTVYCVANDNYRKPSETTLASEHGSQSPSDLSDFISSASDPGVEPYTLSDLADPPVLNNVLFVGNKPLQCRVCLVVRSISSMHCCKNPVCEECMKTYISSQVFSGLTEIVCPIPECSGYLAECVVLAHLASENVAKYKYFLELNRMDSGTKTCPKCTLFTSLKRRSLSTQSKDEPKYKVTCCASVHGLALGSSAHFFVFLDCSCWHSLRPRITKKFRLAKKSNQTCFLPQVHIQRVDGCDHMTCKQCNTNFCYRCGEKYRQLRFFGDHTSNLSVFGCKYRYLPEKPHLRRLIRGSVC
ncbi:putative E3 ubiquitin-protein ligase RNF217, partial [Silurus asotus]